MNPVIAYFDGLAEPNPGLGCGGFVVLPHEALDGEPIAGHRAFGDPLTNNQSEYLAALMALATLWRAGYRGPVVLRGDSQLVVRQFTGQYGCSAPLIVPLLARLRVKYAATHDRKEAGWEEAARLWERAEKAVVALRDSS